LQEQCNELEAKISPHKSQTQLPQWGDAPVHGHSRVQLSWRDWDGDDHAQDKSVASALEPSEAAVANKQTRGPETRGPPQTRCPSSPGEMVPNTSAAACASTPAPTAAQQSATREWFDAVQGDDESFTSIDFEDEHNSCRHERKKETTVVDARTEEGGRGRKREDDRVSLAFHAEARAGGDVSTAEHARAPHASATMARRQTGEGKLQGWVMRALVVVLWFEGLCLVALCIGNASR
jgi:hypothetical protein